MSDKETAPWMREAAREIYMRSASYCDTDELQTKTMGDILEIIARHAVECRAPAPQPAINRFELIDWTANGRFGCGRVTTIWKKPGEISIRYGAAATPQVTAPQPCGKNMGNDLLIIPCDLPRDHKGPCERNVWPVNAAATSQITAPAPQPHQARPGDALLRQSVLDDLTDAVRTAKKVAATPQVTPMPGYSLDDYMNAPSHGPLHPEWQDKPHRLIYDLVARIRALEGTSEQASQEKEKP